MRRLFLIAVLFIPLSAAAVLAGTPARVTIDEHHRFILNGKPWFPIGLASPPGPTARHPSGRLAMDVVVGSGMNCFRVGSDEVWKPGDETKYATFLDMIAERGAYAFPNLRNTSVFDPQHPEREETMRMLATRFKDHPAVALWCLMDEPGWRKYPASGMVPAHRWIKSVDPNHPTWINHAPRNTVRELRPYNEACDVTGVDIYPISVPPGRHSHLPNKEISCVGDYMDWCHEIAERKKPIIIYLQGVWSGVVPPQHTLVFPTFHQERYMFYQAVIKGARGILFFGAQWPYEPRDKELQFNWTLWNDVFRPLMREVGEGSEIHSALLAVDSRLPLKVSGAPDIEFTVREVGPYAYIIAAKREGAPASVRFEGGFIKGSVEVMFEDRTLETDVRSFTDSFDANDVHIYKLRLR